MSAAISLTRERSLDATPLVRPANDEQPVLIDVLDVDDVARLIRIGRNTIYELVGRNEIPHRRCGKQIRFSRAAVMRWLDAWSSQGAKEGQ
jgi:excisionase family DNA binding protein